MQSYPQTLKHLLKNHGMTQEALAATLDVSVTTVAKYCQGRHAPSQDFLVASAIALELTPFESMDYFLTAGYYLMADVPWLNLARDLFDAPALGTNARLVRWRNRPR